MAPKMALSLLAISYLFSLFPSTQCSIFTNELDQWCNTTPNPEACKYFFRQSPKNLTIPRDKSEFRKLSIEIAMQTAIAALNHIKWLEPKCPNDKEKSAWADCLKLHAETILELNQTLTTKCTDHDVQTWLSAALTNLETCSTGFIELGLTDNLLPLMSKNLTKLISNTLALNPKNDTSSIPPQTYKDGFPSWVTTHDRKLLEAFSVDAPNLVVAQDGSGNFLTIKEAVNAAAKRSGSERFVIYIKQGVYNENIEIGKKMKNIMLVGDGMDNTIITGSRSFAGGFITFHSATLGVAGGGFIARDLTIRNTAGPKNHQAVALRSGSDLSVFYHCSIEGYQDTLYVHSHRQFYRECDIYGTVDFIFGNAAVVFQNCMIYARKPMSKQNNIITAQGRTDPNQNTGISIINSKVVAAADLQPVLSSFKSFLGRPWKQYSRTVYLETYIDSLIDPAGWIEWNGNFGLSTLYYGEYDNTGPGASINGRVKWKGYRVIKSAAEASKFSVANFIAGESWLPSTGIPFTPGL